MSVLRVTVCITLLFLEYVDAGHEPIQLKFAVPENTHNTMGIGDLSPYVHLENNAANNQSGMTQLRIIRGRHKELFYISEYRLLPKQGLDREQICPEPEHQSARPCEVNLDIAVLNLQLINILKVNITVLDMNDNSPQFTVDQYNIDVPSETQIGSKFLLPHAVDADSGQNSLQGYRLTEVSPNHPGLFFLDTSDSSPGYSVPKIVLNSRLTRDTLLRSRSMRYNLIAFDGGTPLKSGSVKISVNILESNKHSPVFQKSHYNASCLETMERGSDIITVHAVDIDQGINGRILYYFQGKNKNNNPGSSQSISPDGLMQISQSTGVISLYQEGKALDYETQTVYHYTVVAQDQAKSRPLVAAADVTLHVLDVNDNSPEISINTVTADQRLIINENSLEGTFVALISVRDADTGPNSHVTCEVMSEEFLLYPLFDYEYQLVIAGTTELDYETQSSYNLTVTCVDKGHTPLTSQVKVDLHIIDMNDNSPVFSQSMYTASLRENITSSVPVTSLHATDIDSGINGHIKYKLDEKARRWLDINSINGEVYTIRPLDYEQMSELIFTVIAYDLGNPPLQSTSTVNLSITDINDEPPHFTEAKYTFGSFENQDIGTEIGTISASDPDTPPFDQFEFYVVNDTYDARSFSVHPQTGTIRTLKVLDRESRSTYYLHLGARDTQPPHLSSQVTIIVYIADKNDNSPLIHFPRQGNNTARLPVTARKGQAFTHIEASDPDYGSNSLLSYTIIHGNDQGLFFLNSYDGALSLAHDVEVYPVTEWTLKIAVSDHGKPVPLSNAAILKVVLDESVLMPKISDHQHDNGTITHSSAGLSHMKLMLIFACITVALIVALVLVICVIKVKQRRAVKQSQLHGYKESSHNSKEELETLHCNRNIYDPLPYMPPIPIIINSEEKAQQRRSHIDSVSARERLPGVSESPCSQTGVEDAPGSQRGEEGWLEEIQLNITQAASVSSNNTGGSQTPDTLEAVRDLKPMEASNTDMQLFTLILWLKEVQKTEKHMSENVPEISLPGSSSRGTSLDFPDTLSPQESDGGIFQKHSYLQTISPYNTFCHQSGGNSHTGPRHSPASGRGLSEPHQMSTFKGAASSQPSYSNMMYTPDKHSNKYSPLGKSPSSLRKLEPVLHSVQEDYLDSHSQTADLNFNTKQPNTLSSDSKSNPWLYSPGEDSQYSKFPTLLQKSNSGYKLSSDGKISNIHKPLEDIRSSSDSNFQNRQGLYSSNENNSSTGIYSIPHKSASTKIVPDIKNRYNPNITTPTSSQKNNLKLSPIHSPDENHSDYLESCAKDLDSSSRELESWSSMEDENQNDKHSGSEQSDHGDCEVFDNADDDNDEYDEIADKKSRFNKDKPSHENYVILSTFKPDDKKKTTPGGNKYTNRDANITTNGQMDSLLKTDNSMGKTIEFTDVNMNDLNMGRNQTVV